MEVYSSIGCTSDKYALAFVSVEHLYKFCLKKLSTLKALAVILLICWEKDSFVLT